MTVGTLRKKMQRVAVRYIIWLPLVFIFVLGCFVSFGRGTPGGRRGRQKLPTVVVCKVNGQKITREEFNTAVGQMAEFMGGDQVTRLRFIKEQALESIIAGDLKNQAARREHVRVSADEVDKRIDELVDQEVEYAKMQARSPARFARMIRREFGDINKLKENLRSKKDRDKVAQEVKLKNLEDKVKGRAQVTEQQYQDSLAKIHAFHILVKPQPVTGKPADRKKAEAEAERAAKEKAERLLSELKGGADFATVAKRESDDLANKAKGGDIGYFRRDEKKWMYGEAFEKAAFALKAGEISEAVKGPDGYHIIKVVDRKIDLPADFNQVTYECEGEKTVPDESAEPAATTGKAKGEPAKLTSPPKTKKVPCKKQWTQLPPATKCPDCGSTKFRKVKDKKEEYLDTFRDAERTKAWNDYTEKLRKQAKIVRLDPELAAMKAQQDGKTSLAIKKCKEALQYVNTGDPYLRADAIYYLLASLYESTRKSEEAIAAYEKVLEYTDLSEVHLALGRLYRETKRDKKALEQFALASENATDTEPYVHDNLAREYEHMGKKDLATKERHLSKAARAARPPGFGGLSATPITIPAR